MHTLGFNTICEIPPLDNQGLLFPFLKKQPILPIQTYFLDQILIDNSKNIWKEENWDDFSVEKEYETFLKLAQKSLDSGKQAIIFGITLEQECAFMKNIYQDLGFFSIEKNAFVLDFKNCPLFIGVHFNHLLWSKKECRREKEKTNFLLPPREANHQKHLKHSINAGIISFLQGYYDEKKDTESISQLLYEEKISPIKLGRAGFFHYEEIWADIEKEYLTIPSHHPEEIY